MSEKVIKQIRLSFTGPESLPLAVVRRESPDYDGPRSYFTVSLKNESDGPVSLPLDELKRNVVMVYRNPATGREKVDNRTPPPKMDGAVESLQAGKTTSFQVVFEYPADLATTKNRVAELEFCVKWKKEWLRDSAYAPRAYNWNESYELCRQIRIVDE